jgi:hypothetical protein
VKVSSNADWTFLLFLIMDAFIVIRTLSPALSRPRVRLLNVEVFVSPTFPIILDTEVFVVPVLGGFSTTVGKMECIKYYGSPYVQ